MGFNIFRRKSTDNNSFSGEKTRRYLLLNLRNSIAENRNQQQRKKNCRTKTKRGSKSLIPRTQSIDSDYGYESSASTEVRSYISQNDLQKERINENHEINGDNNNNGYYGYGIPDYTYNNRKSNTNKNCKEIDYGYGDASPDSALQQHQDCHQHFNNNIDDLGYDIGYRTMRTKTGNTALLLSSSDHTPPRRSSLKHKGTPRRASIGYKGEMTLVLPNGKEKKKRMSISFVDDAENQTKEVRPIHKMVDNNKRLWFQAEEYRHIQKEIHRILTDSQLQPHSRNSSCTRGLENFSYGNAGDARKIASSEVIEEYMLQKSRGEYDDETIKQMYTFHTIESQVEAAERGQKDAESIETYLKDTRKYLRRMSS